MFQPAECNELRPYLSLFQDASLVCVLHGLMVPLGGGHSYAQSRRQRQRGIERHYKLILQTLMLFTRLLRYYFVKTIFILLLNEA